MNSQADPDFCQHGRRVGERCFFCDHKPRTVAETEALIPEHRNPPAREKPPNLAAASRGGQATRRRKLAAKAAIDPAVRAALAIEQAAIERLKEELPVAPSPPEPPQLSPPFAYRADIAGRRGGLAAHQPLPRALRRMRNLERELKRMQEILARTVADLVAASKGGTP